MPHPRRVIVNDAAANQLLTLDDSESHYLRNVLRLTCGSAVSVVSKSNQETFDSFITALEPRVQLQLRAPIADRSSQSAVQTLLLPLLKGDHSDMAIEKCTELGVLQFNIFQAERSVIKLQPRNQAARHARFEKIAVAAARQSGRAVIPQIKLHASLADTLSDHPAANELLYCSLEEHAEPIAASTQSVKPISLAIGPEGDFAPHELALLTQYGGKPVSLGAMLLRSETAAIAAVAMLHARMQHR